MGRKIEITAVVFSLFALLSACNGIIEERMDCPCMLTIDTGAGKHINAPVHLWILDANSGVCLFRDTINMQMPSMEIEIMRTEKLQICAVAGISDNTRLQDDLSMDTCFEKKDGVPCDSLYFYSNIISTVSEFAADTIDLHKDHAKVKVSLEGAAAGIPIFIDLLFSSVGRYVDGEYVSGNGHISGIAPYRVSNDRMLYSCILNRQESLEDLRLLVYADMSPERYVINDFPLGEYLLEAGYDVAEPDMQDIEVSLDVALSLVTVTVGNWQNTVHVKVEL